MGRLPAVVAAALSLSLVAPAQAATPSPAFSPTPSTGVSVVPDAGSRYLSARRNALRVPASRPGRTLTETVFVLNTSDRTLRVALYPADGLPAQNGGYGYADRTARPTGVGAWLRLSRSEAVLPPKSRLDLTVGLRVGADAANGRNVGAVVVEPLDQGAGPVQSITRFAMPFVVEVTGGRRATTAAAPRPAPARPASPVVIDRLRTRPLRDLVCSTVRVRNGSSQPLALQLEVQSDGPLAGGSRRTVLLPPLPSLTSREVGLPCVERPIGPGKLRVWAALPGQPPAAVAASLFWVPLPVTVSLFLLLLVIAALLRTFLLGWKRRTEDDDEECADAESADAAAT